MKRIMKHNEDNKGETKTLTRFYTGWTAIMRGSRLTAGLGLQYKL